jgi:hypothetical protein
MRRVISMRSALLRVAKAQPATFAGLRRSAAWAWLLHVWSDPRKFDDVAAGRVGGSRQTTWSGWAQPKSAANLRQSTGLRRLAACAPSRAPICDEDDSWFGVREYSG